MTMMSAAQTSLSCPAKAGHPVIAKLEINPVLRRILDHPPEPLIGPATSGRTRWRMMTTQEATS
jgi:hypothetical protein